METRQLWPGWNTVRTIGTGGFGKVYEICKEDATGEYRSALKVITIPASPDEYNSYKDDGYDEASITAIFKSQVDDVVSEYKLMAQFKGTSNIVSYEDHMIVPHDDGRGWDILIRMEMLTSLPDYYNSNKLSSGDIAKIGIDICHALELCSKKNIVHRDIKPQNIFVNEFGDFKLGDFGVAKAMDHTTKATKIGTYSYMAPEVYQNQPYSSSADMYSLGLVLYWLLNDRRLPFLPLPPAVPTASKNTESQMKRLSGETIPMPKNGTDDLKNVVIKACSYKSEDRYQTLSEMKQALENADVRYEKQNNAPAKDTILTPPAPQVLPDDEDADNTIGLWDPTVGKDYKPEETSATSKENPNVCPYCNHGKVKVFHRTNKDEYWATEEVCTVCHGSGILKAESAEAIIKQFEFLKENDEYKNANHNCDCCNGIGFVRYSRLKNGLRQCPKCAGKKIIPPPIKPKEKGLALFLTILPYTGAFGINRIYEGNWLMFLLHYIPGFVYGGWVYSIVETARRPKIYYPTNFLNDTKLPDQKTLKLP